MKRHLYAQNIEQIGLILLKLLNLNRNGVD